MDQDTKRRIDLVLAEAADTARSGTDVWVAARAALSGQQSDVYRELAIAAIVDTVEARLRSEALKVEVEAERARRALLAEATSSTARRDSEWAEREAQSEARLHATLSHVARITTEMLEQFRIEWTAELLDTQIALGDGTKVLWGDATVEQHAQRAQMFERNAVANLDGAARHRLAIRELEASGASTLREMVGAAA